MSSPSEIIDMSAALMNDKAQSVYTDEACLPYLNMALDELQELFELNNIPVTNETSSIITVPTSTVITAIGFNSIPSLPIGLIEIQELWEGSNDQFIPVTKKDFLPHYNDNIQFSQFRIWAWMNQEIRLPPNNSIIDLKIDYIKSIFATPILISQIGVDLEIKNSKSYLGYRTGALCAEFIGENKTRADELNQFASISLDRTLGISTKGRQSITIRRRPFRANYKSRSQIR